MITRVLLIPVLLVASGLALADEEAWFKLSGYGTLAATHSSNDQADFRSNLFQPVGAGYTRSTDIGTDSKLAVQLDTFFSPTLTATVQMLSQRNYDDTFTPNLEWANLKYKPVDSFYVRIGRVLAPTFMIAEYRNVGYAQTMVRPNNDVYFWLPLFNLDGMDMGYSMDVGSTTLNLQLAAGKYKQDLTTLRSSFGSNIVIKNDSILFNSTLEYGDAAFRFGYIWVSNFSVSSGTFSRYDSLVDELVANNVANAATVRSNVRFDNLNGSQLSLGVKYDPGSWLTQGEMIWTKFDTNSIPDIRAWYLMAGRRIGKWTPYLSYSRVQCMEDYNLPYINANSSSQLNAAAVDINSFNRVLQLKEDESTLSVGVRYDIWKHMDLKLQLDHIEKPAGSIAAFTQEQPGFVENKQHINIVTLAFDFVF
jgi:hypothetical protein